MADEKRLIDADKTQKVLENMSEHLREAGRSALAMAIGYAAEVIDKQPTVDAVEVVRCKNCERSLKIPDEGIFCSIWGRGWCRMEPDDFCPHGERRGDNGR